MPPVKPQIGRRWLPAAVVVVVLGAAGVAAGVYAGGSHLGRPAVSSSPPPGGSAEILYADGTVLATADEVLHPTGPVGVVVRRVLEDLTALHQPAAGARITTTIDPKLQQALVRQADATVDGAVMNSQPGPLQAAAVAVQPGTGRILAYFGGRGSDVDFAQQHPPGNAFSPVTLAAALKAGISLQSTWLAPAEMEFPGRTVRQGNPVRDVKRCPGGKPSCSLLDAQRDGLRVPLYAVAEKIGPASIVDMARACGAGTLWTRTGNEARAIPLEQATTDLYPRYFGTEIAFGSYPLTLTDEANVMATFAAGGRRADAHLIAEVSYGDRVAVRADERSAPAVDAPVVSNVTWALSRQPAGLLAGGRRTAAATGEWQVPRDPSVDPAKAPPDLTTFAHAAIAGYTPQVAVAVWVGNKADERPLTDRTGAPVTGATLPAQIYRQFLAVAMAGVPHTDIVQPPPLGDPKAGNA